MVKPTYEEYKQLTVEAVELYHRQDYEGALLKLLYLAEHNPENAKVHELLSYLYLKKGNVEKAENEFQIYLDLLIRENPSLQPLKRSFDDVVRDAGDFEEKKMRYEKFMSQDRELDLFEDGAVASALSVHYLSRGDYEQAERILIDFKTKYEKQSVQRVS